MGAVEGAGCVADAGQESWGTGNQNLETLNNVKLTEIAIDEDGRKRIAVSDQQHACRDENSMVQRYPRTEKKIGCYSRSL